LGSKCDLRHPSELGLECADKPTLSESGFYKMMQAGDEALFQRYARAREIQANRMPPGR
jgi:hypothetical protein